MEAVQQRRSEVKTRNEMIYDFMLALCSNANSLDLSSTTTQDKLDQLEAYQGIYLTACEMTDQYLRSLG